MGALLTYALNESSSLVYIDDVVNGVNVPVTVRNEPLHDKNGGNQREQIVRESKRICF